MEYAVKIKYYNSLIDSECERIYEVILTDSVEEEVEVIDMLGEVSWEDASEYSYDVVDIETKMTIGCEMLPCMIDEDDAINMTVKAFQRYYAGELLLSSYVFEEAVLIDDKTIEQLKELLNGQDQEPEQDLGPSL